MERLTERLGDYNNPKEICAVWVKNYDYVSAAQRLADYEDIADTVGGFDRLRELAEADKDGRLVVLPCKPGDTVYMISWRLNGRHKIEERVFSLTYFDPAKYGKDYFLSREEAEKALEAMKNE